MYLYELPTTGAISFSDFIITNHFTSQVSQATELRAKLRTLLKENRAGQAKSEDGRKDWLRILKAVEDYLPHLFAIFNCIQTDDLLLRYEPEFSWRTTLSSSTFRAPPRISLPSLYYEMCSTLFLSGAALSNFAASAASSLGDFERDRNLSDAQRKANDDRLRWAADTLCRACGIFEHLSEVLIPQWENQVGRIDARPPDITREVTLALSKLALAEAQTLAIRKLLSPSLSLAIDTITPGPPLLNSHPSPSLLAKLHLNVAALFESAHSLAKTVGKKSASSRLAELDCKPLSSADIGSGIVDDDNGRDGGKKALFGRLKSLAGRDNSHSSRPGGSRSSSSLGPDWPQDADLQVGSSLLRYVSSSASLHRALAYKWLGVDSGENGGKIGQGIAFLRMAKDGLEKGSARDAMKAQREAELKSVDHWIKSYIKLNDTPIPKASHLQSKVPAGRAALNSKAYQMPMPAFGPGSPGFVSEVIKRSAYGATASEDELQVERLAMGGLSIGKPKDEAGDYAGAGAYY